MDGRPGGQKGGGRGDQGDRGRLGDRSRAGGCPGGQTLSSPSLRGLLALRPSPLRPPTPLPCSSCPHSCSLTFQRHPPPPAGVCAGPVDTCVVAGARDHLRERSPGQRTRRLVPSTRQPQQVTSMGRLLCPWLCSRIFPWSDLLKLPTAGWASVPVGALQGTSRRIH